MTDLVIRKTPQDLLKMKAELLKKLDEIRALNKSVEDSLEDYRMYSPYRLEFNFKFFGENAEVKWIDQKCWNYLIELYELHKYMACTEYEKLQKDLENGHYPEFTEANVESYILGLKSLVWDNVKGLLKRVYSELINGHYYTGSGYSSREKKKRNNAGLDKNFILSTRDYTCIFGYAYNYATVTDDLEKVCYILDGLKLPEQTIKDQMKTNKKHEAENKYFKIRVCKNGNTHYTIFKDTLDKLNKYGSDSSMLGEKIKIRIFERS
jgi:hypothetical protein